MFEVQVLLISSLAVAMCYGRIPGVWERKAITHHKIVEGHTFKEDFAHLMQNLPSHSLIHSEISSLFPTFIIIGEDREDREEHHEEHSAIFSLVSEATMRFATIEDFFSSDIRSLNSSKNGPTIIVGDFFPEDIQQIMFEAKYRLRLMTIVTTVVQPNWQQEGIVGLTMSYYITRGS